MRWPKKNFAHIFLKIAITTSYDSFQSIDYLLAVIDEDLCTPFKSGAPFKYIVRTNYQGCNETILEPKYRKLFNRRRFLIQDSFEQKTEKIDFYLVKT